MTRRPVRVSDPLHKALKEMQKEFKRQRGEEPALGELVEKAFKEDPDLKKVVEDKEKPSDELWEDEEFMKL